MKNEYYISGSQNLLSNETSRKWRKKYHGSIINSWKYIIKTLIRSRKMLLIGGNKLQKHIKNPCFQTINTLFSRYNRNVSLKT